jgi:hypothetical protein
VQMSRAPDFSVLELDASGITDTVYQAPPMLGFTRYYWRVSARSLDGSSTSAYSSPRYYTTVLDTPAVQWPSSDLIEQPVTMNFRWKRVSYAETYRLEVSKDELFLDVAYVDSTTLDTARSVGPLEGMTTYWWRLRSQNPADVSEYTATRRFATTIATPGLSLPLNGEQLAPLTPTFAWQSVPGAARYRVQVATDTLMTQIVFDDSLVAATSRSVGPLPRLLKHYWRVRAKSADGRSIGAYSPIWSFRTVPAPPSATTLVAPVTGLLDQSRTVQCKWRKATGAETYGLTIATDSLFTQLAVNDTSITDTVYTPAPLEGLMKHYWRVRAINPGGTSAATPYWSFTTILATPLTVSPAHNAPDQPVSIRIVWSKVPRATTYRLQLSTDSLFKTTLFDDSTLVDTARMLTGLGRSVTYFWRIRARAAGGASTSLWSSAQRFITVPDPPAMPVLSLPVANAKNVPISTTISWQYAARAARYHLQLAADTAFEFIILQDSTIADTLRTLDSLEYYTTYFWRIRATNVGGMSAWTARRQFLTTIAVPAIVGPAADAVNQPVQITLAWNAPKGAARYRIVLSSDSLLRSPFLDDTLVTSPSRVVTGLSYTTNYFWRVTARSADNACVSLPSAIRKFTTIIEKPPMPELISPADLAEGIPASASLLWRACDRATRYHVQLSADSLYTQSRLNDSTYTDTLRAPTGLLPHTAYWWRVRAGNLAGFSAFSASRKYITSIATPTAVAPPDSATGITSSVTMRWTASPGAANYVLEISTDSLFGSFFLRDSTVTGITRDITGLEPFTLYHWRVKAVDARGAGAYSDVAVFTTKLVAPMAPLQEAPRSGVGSLLTSQTFRWHPSRLANTYNLQIATDSPFDSTVYDQHGIRDTFMTVTSLHYSTTYFWRVRGTNSEGDGTFSSVWSFTSAVAPPATPALLAPGSASNGQLPNVKLIWRSSPHADRYHLQVATDAPFATPVYSDSTLKDTVMTVGPLHYTTTYYWRVRATNSDWTTTWSPVWSLTVMSPPVAYDLYQNFPNPGNPSTVIRYDIPAEAQVDLVLYNLLGQAVRTMVSAVQKAGRYDYSLDAGDLPSGVYFYRIVAKSTGVLEGTTVPPTDSFVKTFKMMILK